MTTYAVGDTVTWKWGKGEGKGTVTKISPYKVTKTIRGSRIVRKGSPENPVLNIEQDGGDNILKLASEASKA